MADQLDNAMNTISEAIECHKGCEKEINTLKEKIVECNNNATDMRNEMENKFQNFKISSGQILKEELRVHKARLAKYSNDLLQKNKTIEEELKKIQHENADLKKQIGLVDTVNSNETLQINLMEKQNNLIREQNGILRQSTGTLEEENKILKQSLSTLELRISRLEGSEEVVK